MEEVNCVECGEAYSVERRKLGFLTCVTCGESKARSVRHLVIPVHKSNDMVIPSSAREMLKGAGCKGGQVLGGGAGETTETPKAPNVSDSTRSNASGGVDSNGKKVVSSQLTAYTPKNTGAKKTAQKSSPSIRRIVLPSASTGCSSGDDSRHGTRRDPWFKRSGYKR